MNSATVFVAEASSTISPQPAQAPSGPRLRQNRLYSSRRAGPGAVVGASGGHARLPTDRAGPRPVRRGDGAVTGIVTDGEEVGRGHQPATSRAGTVALAGPWPATRRSTRRAARRARRRPGG